MSLADDKRKLRAHMKMLRDSMSADEREVQSRLTCEALLALPCMQALVNHKATIALFSPLGSEINILHLVPALSDAGCRLGVPVVLDETHMEFVEVSAQELLAERCNQPDFLSTPAKKLSLPPHYSVISPEEFDVVLMPGLAFDRQGNRLGYGAGYYDMYISRIPNVLTIAPIFEIQLVDEVPVEENDIPVSYVVTPQQVIKAR